MLMMVQMMQLLVIPVKLLIEAQSVFVALRILWNINEYGLWGVHRDV